MAAIPPGAMGPPLLGHTLGLVFDPLSFAQRQTQRYGPVWKTRFFNVPTVALIGAEAQRFVLVDAYRNFLWKEGYGIGYELFGDGLMWLDGTTHDTHRQMMQPAFHGHHLSEYLNRINRIADEQLTAWKKRGRRSFYEDARQIAFRLASSLLLGIDVGRAYSTLIHAWETFSNGPLTLLHWDLPWMRYGRAMHARTKLDAVVAHETTLRRAEPASDVLSLLVQAQTAEGQPLTDEQIQAHMRFLFFAAYDTTASTMSWLLLELLHHPDLMERIREEVCATAPDEPVTLDEIRRQPFLDAAINETLRLHPQVSWVLRGVQQDCEFAGYRLPAGWHVMLIPPVTHRLPEYFAEPDRFDPDRFLAPRQEQKQHPLAWIGFGGGPRTCLGEAVAKMEIKAVFTRLLRRYAVSLLPRQDLTPQYVPLSRPRCDVRVRYRVNKK